jgi:hypothetical protein
MNRKALLEVLGELEYLEMISRAFEEASRALTREQFAIVARSKIAAVRAIAKAKGPR